MASTHVDTVEDLRHALHYWKQHSFDKSYIKLNDAVQSLQSESRLVEARASYLSRWVLAPEQQKGVKEAMFHTAAIWRWNSDLETGNFVLPGHGAETTVAESRIQWELNTYCQLSYALDTQYDKSIWDAQKAFEEHALSLRGFNRTCKKRRTWQDGTGNLSSYMMSSNLVVRRATVSPEVLAQFPYDIHPWIKAATKDNPNYVANPNRPRMFELVQGTLRDIKDCDPPHLSKGDLVWVSFSVEFLIGGQAWSTNFIPYEIVRVGTVSLGLIGGEQNISNVPTAPQRGLQVGLRVPMNDDFPMYNVTNTLGSSQPLGTMAPQLPEPTRHHSDISSASLESRNIPRAESPDYWSPSPTESAAPAAVGASSSELDYIDFAAVDAALEGVRPTGSPTADSASTAAALATDNLSSHHVPSTSGNIVFPAVTPPLSRSASNPPLGLSEPEVITAAVLHSAGANRNGMFVASAEVAAEAANDVHPGVSSTHAAGSLHSVAIADTVTSLTSSQIALIPDKPTSAPEVNVDVHTTQPIPVGASDSIGVSSASVGGPLLPSPSPNRMRVDSSMARRASTVLYDSHSHAQPAPSSAVVDAVSVIHTPSRSSGGELQGTLGNVVSATDVVPKVEHTEPPEEPAVRPSSQRTAITIKVPPLAVVHASTRVSQSSSQIPTGKKRRQNESGPSSHAPATDGHDDIVIGQRVLRDRRQTGKASRAV